MPLSRRGIGQRALERVVLAEQGRAERLEIGIQHLEPARIVRREAGLAFDHVQRCPLLRAELGQHQRAVRKIEAGMGDLARELRSPLAPVQPARDHQVQHQPQIAFEPDRDPLADTAQAQRPCGPRPSGSAAVRS